MPNSSCLKWTLKFQIPDNLWKTADSGFGLPSLICITSNIRRLRELNQFFFIVQEKLPTSYVPLDLSHHQPVPWFPFCWRREVYLPSWITTMLPSQLWLEEWIFSNICMGQLYYTRKIQVIIVYNLMIKVEININIQVELFTDENSWSRLFSRT